MNKSGILSDIGSELKSLGKDVVKTVATEPKSLAKKAAQQIGLEHGEVQKEIREPKGTEGTKDQEKANKELLEAMYGPSKQEGSEGPPPQAVSESKVTPEHQQTHSASYYQPLIQKIEQGGKTPEDLETTAERVERLEMKDLEEKQKKEEKKKPISVDRAERSIEGATKDAAG